MQTLSEYLSENLGHTVLIKLNIDDYSFDYTLWNYIEQHKQFNLLRNDHTIAHILYDSQISIQKDGSILYENQKFNPKKCLLNFYFGGYSN